MTKILNHYICLTVWFVNVYCDFYNDRPKIRTENGNLILEPAQDKNIYLLPNGPQSTVYIGDVSLRNITATKTTAYLPAQIPDVENLINDRRLLDKLTSLEYATNVSLSSLQLNMSLIRIRINRLATRINNLNNLISSMTREECQSQTCQHGGTCLDLVNGYHCLCPSNWEGRNCDIDVNECRNFAGTDLGCQNGADCVNKPGSYECHCRPGWYGLHCTRKDRDCSGGNFEMCGHGMCISQGDGIKCICEQGWTTNGTGVACLTDVDECDTSLGVRCSVNPRVPCINLPGSFRCGQCPPGYEGDGYTCSDIDECLTVSNGGCSPMVTCHNTVGSRICGPCPVGYVGDGITCTWRGACNINHGGCHPSAQCIDSMPLGGQIPQCVCPEGMEGDGIGLQGCYVSTRNSSRESCQGNPCGPNGQCHTLPTGYTCLCFRGFTGAYCHIAANPCVNNPCRNGGLCRRDDTVERAFRCECTAQYTGTLCQVRAQSCGGVLNAEEGSIVYPLSNITNYEPNSKCAWIIHTIATKVINVTFTKFNLEDSEDCQFDFLQIHDGRSSSDQLIGRFCGNSFPKGGNFVSSHNNLYFWFRSDSSLVADGFALHWNSIDPVCGGEIDARRHGRISSPGSPGKYPPNRDCYWHLTTTFGKRILLHFFELDIESHANCSFDYLAIYDGDYSTDPLLNRYCSSTQPSPVQSAGSEVLVHFHSDSYGSGKGFQISFAPVDGIPGCGGFYTTERGEIVSPSYDGRYLSNLICEYKIKVSPDAKILIEFKSFNLENSQRCKYDYLKVYDGPSADSRLVGRFCGSVNYPKSYISSSNNVFIKFKTDRTTAAEGFRITYQSICQYIINGDSGIIKSPGYPFSYPANKVCEYIIGAAPGKAIQLTFQDFDVEDTSQFDCVYDNVEIRDGPNVNSSLLGKFCGSSRIPPVQISTHNFMYVKFNTDMSISGTGFYANFTTINTECGGIYKTNSGIISHPSSDTRYKNRQSCVWLLIAPDGMHIMLTWNKFDIENLSHCGADYLELIEIDYDNKNETMGKYCGKSSPPVITTSTNKLMLKFVSDSSITQGGFSLSYSFLDERTHCGGNYVKKHGFIYSPGWPKQYEPNRDCTWIINVPTGQRVQLNISQFDLERPIGNRCYYGDFLEIRNGASPNSPLIDKYCGKFQWKRVISTANSLYLRFHSDYYLTGKGFVIEWDGTIRGCGGTLTSASGIITSPNYPQNYKENSECFYRIATNQGSKIKLRFTELDLEVSKLCTDDYVEIFDGRDPTSRSIGKYCTFTSPMTFETTANYAYVKFHSDVFNNGKGFVIEYSTVCNINLTGTYGVIESPNFPNDYPSNINCLWTINVPKGNKINITFTDFDIYRSVRYWMRSRGLGDRYGSTWPRTFHLSNGRNFVTSECDKDYLQVLEPSRPSDRKLCGSVLPAQINTIDNSLQIKFVAAGIYGDHKGFRLEWVSYGCGGHIQKRFGGLDKTLSSSKQVECEWLIETPVGTSIVLIIRKLYVTNTENCTIDAVEIFNGPTTQSPLLTKLCHNGDWTIQSSSNFLLMRLTKLSELRDVNFSFQFSSTASTCGGIIRSPSGIITSKNFPKNYDNNLDCIWTITVPDNHRIELQFTTLDLYSNSIYSAEMTSCDDYIKLYDDYHTLRNNYTYKICPDSKMFDFVTRSSTLIMQFITNGHGEAKGFKAIFNMTCGAVITATTEGDISNKNYISHSNATCTWVILAPSLDQKIFLTITHLSLPKNNSIGNKQCPSSFLRVLDGNDENAPLIDEYCGNKAPPMIVSRGSAITVQLGTHENKIIGRFHARYAATINACGGTLTSEEGYIASPNYPMPYPVSANCEWKIKTSSGNRVYIIFESFDLEYSEECNDDYLEVRENGDGGHLLGVYCGSTIPINTTTASELFIKFHSDDKTPGKGFLIRYGILIGNYITTGERGEITSPLYPIPYNRPGEYWWRIIRGKHILSIIVDALEIHTYGETCYDNLSFYDGLNEEAPLLKQLCGALHDTNEVIRTTSNAVYIKLTLHKSDSGTIFHLRWSEDFIDTDDVKTNCGSNSTEEISPGQTIQLRSPNYPNDYDDDLNCEWVYKATYGRHLKLNFIDFNVEEIHECFSDAVSIYSSQAPTVWKPVKENICRKEDALQDFNATKFMLIKFHTDSSVTRKGFLAQLKSMCGGEITDPSGVIGPDAADFHNIYQKPAKCHWLVKVRPGRLIKLQFEYFNITNEESDCYTYVTLRNGDSEEAPFLASGKYCGYSHEIRTEITTTSNNLFISYVSSDVRTSERFQTFMLRYEEQSINCGSTSKLDNDHSWEVINSPNYPSVPDPYSECNWELTGPPGEILRVDFIGRFDLENKEDCASECVEIHDGTSDLSHLIGRFCNGNPGTIKTSSNSVFIKYVTQLLEPNNGFKANVSIDVCGGTIRASEGEVISPGYPNMISLPPGTVCEWHVIGRDLFNLMLKPRYLNLPESVSSCGTKVTVEEVLPANNTIVVLKTFCSEDLNDLSVITTLTNKISIKLYLGEPSAYKSISQYRGFKFTFNSSIPRCGGRISTPEGYLMTPGYPRDTTIKYCHWKIVTPDETRRITLEIIDAGIETHRIGIYNDLLFESSIAFYPEYDPSSRNRTFESSGNKMAIFVGRFFLKSGTHRFKAKFSSNEPALCGGSLEGLTGELTSPTIDRSYSCEWHYHLNPDLVTNSSIYKTIYVTARINSSSTSTKCRYSDPKLYIKATWNGIVAFQEGRCDGEISYRLPSTEIDFKATRGSNKYLYFRVNWKLQPCGGTLHLSGNEVDVLHLLQNYSDSLDCAWVIEVPTGNKVEIKLEGFFELDCTDEFVKVKRNFAYSGRTTDIGHYCKDKPQDGPLILGYKNIFVEYHSKGKNSTSIKVMAKKATYICGGLSTMYDSIFASPNYPDSYTSNLECTWEINSALGTRISLHFIGRFVIEKHPNCSKDAVIVYDWKNESYYEIARLCGRDLPPVYNSTYNRMKVTLRTDAEKHLDGFKAQWVPICGGTYNATATKQYIYSPGYPQYYWPNMVCTYKISAKNQRVLLEFVEFDLEGPYPTCESDNLTITASNEYDYFYNVYCGSETPTNIHSYYDMEITFKSDIYLQKKGFKISYSTYSCGGIIREPQIITSGPVEEYEENLNCTWLIEAPENKTAILKFLYIDLESTYDCFADYIEVYEGPLIDSDSRLALICGHDNNTTILKSKGSTMVVQFITDSSAQYRGFKLEVFFSYSELMGCGGNINMTSSSSYTLKSPFIGSSKIVYEDYLDCHWSIIAPIDYAIKISFSSFHVAPCQDVNQTALGYSKCDCDALEIKDGINPDSILIGTYCGHTLPPDLLTSSNLMGIRLSTDGEIVSSGFIATLTTQKSFCGQSTFSVSRIPQRIKSPSYDTGSLGRGINCQYHLELDSEYSLMDISVINLDLQPGTNRATCDKDRLVIRSLVSPKTSVGKDYVMNKDSSFFLHYTDVMSVYDLPSPQQIVLCGSNKSINFYISNSVTITLQTSPEDVARVYKGFEIEVSLLGYCGRNYTERYGSIQNNYQHMMSNPVEDCYTLITAPENYTISLYIASAIPDYWNTNVFLDIYDGNQTTSKKLVSIKTEYKDNHPVFSTGRYILLHNHRIDNDQVTYNLNYVVTDKGRGCGGYLFAEQGVITSPLYPDIYRQKKTCEWELETPQGTHLYLTFTVFDMGRNCDNNYLQFVNRAGQELSSYCSETPADYTSTDNYVKLVFRTTLNNGGTGWVAAFAGVA